MENPIISSSKKKKSSSKKKVELRYFEEENNFNSSNKKNNKGNFSFFDSDFFSKNKITGNDINLNLMLNSTYRGRSNTDINQKLNFEVINENYQKGNIIFN